MRPRDAEQDDLTTADLAGRDPGSERRQDDPAPTPEPGTERRQDDVAGREPDGAGALIDQGRLDEFRNRWTDVQAGFVDDPRQTVEAADRLVAEIFQHMAQTFADGRAQLEEQWSRGELGTEDLRLLVRRYRVIFDTLLQR